MGEKEGSLFEDEAITESSNVAGATFREFLVLMLQET